MSNPDPMARTIPTGLYCVGWLLADDVEDDEAALADADMLAESMDKVEDILALSL